MEGDEALDLEFGDPAIDISPLESGILDTEAQELTMGLNAGDLAPQGMFRTRSWSTTFGREPMDPRTHGVTFGIEVTPRKPFGRLLAAGGGGAIAGFLLAGPMGAAAGAALGAIAEEAYARYGKHPVAALPPPAPAPAPVVVPASAAPTAPVATTGPLAGTPSAAATT